jgi:hypothetical protein
MKAVFEKKKAKIWMYINEHGMLFLTMVKPYSTKLSPSLTLSEQTVELLLPVMNEDQLMAFYEKETKLTRRANLKEQQIRIQAELDSLCDEEP